MRLIISALTLLLFCGCTAARKALVLDPIGKESRHLRNIRQLTDGGENAEAYFSFDNRRLILQSTREDGKCDQIYTMDLEGNCVRRVSNGLGRTTCAYFYPKENRVLYASTYLAGEACPEEVRAIDGKYVWAIHSSFDIFSSKPNGKDLKRLTLAPGYDAEATISPQGRVVFTSSRDGDLELYTMNLDGSDQQRLTHELGYDGGAFFSNDGSQIIYRAYHPKEEAEIVRYKKFLKMGYVQPTRMDLFIMNADGTHRRQLTDNGKANFCPFFFPDGKRIIFAANLDQTNPRNFDLYMIKTDGTGLERITWNSTFDAFPMFSSDGKHLVFGSNRNGRVRGETNIFLADWVE